MENNEPIYVYDSRTQFTRPMFVVYNFDDVDIFLKAKDNTYDPKWERPDWVYVSKQSMHPYARDTYKVSNSRMTSTSMARSNSRSDHTRLINQNIDYKKKLHELEMKLEEELRKKNTCMCSGGI